MSHAKTNKNNEAVVLPSDALQLPSALQHLEVRACLPPPHETGPCRVYEAWDSTLRRHVLIKHMQNLGNNVDALLAEARLVASLKHASFLKVHALEQVGDSLYIVTEAVVGVVLKDWIKIHHGDERLVVEHLYHLAAALNEAQELGLVHGDLQTANLLIDQSGKVRIVDFALRPKYEAQTIQQLNQLNQMDAYQGIAYLAPERFSDVEPSAQSEVFALGTIVYEMLTGSLPFANLNGLALIAAQVQTQSDAWVWPATISAKAKDLVITMTHREISKRSGYIDVMRTCQEMRPDDPISVSAASLQLNALQAQMDAMEGARRRHRYLAVSLVLALCGLGVWQAKPYWPQIAKALKPYSEMREMEQGIEALDRYLQVPIPAQLELASEHFERILERSPNNARAVAHMSLVYMSRYNNEKRDETWMQKAKASAQQAISLDPSLAASQIANAQVLQWHHKMDEALAAAEVAVKLEPQNLRAWVTKARILLERGDGSAVIAVTEEGTKRFPYDRVLLEINGVIQAERGDFILAEAAYRESIRRQPDSVNSYAQLAKNLDVQGKSEEAMQYLQRGLEIRPNAQLYSAYGKAKFIRSEYIEAAQAFEKAVSPQKGVTGSYFRWLEFAESLMWVSGRESEGIEAFQNSKKLLEIRLARSPDDAYIMSHMGFIQARLGDIASAKQTIRKAAEINPNTDSVYFYGAAVFELAGDRDEALKLIAASKKMNIRLSEFKTHPIFKELRKDPRYQP